MRGLFLSIAVVLFESVQCHVAQVPLSRNGFEHSQHPNFKVDWDQLNKTVGHRLHFNTPFASPCYPKDGGYGPRDIETCKARIAEKEIAVNVSNTPSGYYFSNWASCQNTGESCALPMDGPDNFTVSRTAKCSQGNLPDMYLEVAEESDITAALEFTRKNKVPLVVKNSGHDWKGRSAAPGALALWTHRYRPPFVLVRNFVAEGCSAKVEHAITFGAGYKWSDVYDFANDHNLTVVGGTCPDVGPTGWLAGGGHSPLTPTYGMGVDNVQQIRLALPNGTITEVSRCQHPELFFALTGGGPNTWGVITSMTYQAHPIVPIQEFSLNFTGMDVDNTREFYKILTANATKWAESGWGGYIKPQTKGRFLTLIKPLLNNAQPSDASAEMAPLIEFADRLSDCKTAVVVSQTWPSWHAYVQKYFAPAPIHPASWSASVASRLLPSSLFEKNATDIVTALVDLHFTPAIDLWIMAVTPPGLHSNNNWDDGAAYSLHPAWRNSTWEVRISTTWDQYYRAATPETVKPMFRKVHEAMEPLRRLAPESAASMSESDIWEPRPEETFWGKENFDRLKAIKEEVDPEGHLVVWQGVGWEKAPKDRWKCYPKEKET